MNVPNTNQLFDEYLAGVAGEPVSKGGTTRNVYEIGDKIIKVAKDPKGLQQNEEELKETPNTPQALEEGKDYVVTTKAERDDKEINRWLKPLREYDSEDYEDRNPNLVQLMKNMGLENFLHYNLLWGDFTAARNWGIDQEGKPVLLDKGTLNAKIYEHEEAPKGVKKEYNKIEKERREVKKPPLTVRTHRREVIQNG